MGVTIHYIFYLSCQLNNPHPNSLSLGHQQQDPQLLLVFLQIQITLLDHALQLPIPCVERVAPLFQILFMPLVESHLNLLQALAGRDGLRGLEMPGRDLAIDQMKHSLLVSKPPLTFKESSLSRFSFFFDIFSTSFSNHLELSGEYMDRRVSLLLLLLLFSQSQDSVN